MLHIAVCDDDIKMLGEVKQILTDYCKAKKLAFKISAYCDGTDLLASEESFSVIFLDIEMQQSNGIEVAQKIRRMDMNVPIGVVKKQRSKSRDFLLFGKSRLFFMPNRKNNYFG